ncbi:MAG: hypothetical protein NXH75_17210, partial [Halobacteriovoraceae bacterium]|nr:hypothetical protein [Halobacteriovoraceae bacterium]
LKFDPFGHDAADFYAAEKVVRESFGSELNSTSMQFGSLPVGIGGKTSGDGAMITINSRVANPTLPAEYLGGFGGELSPEGKFKILETTFHEALHATSSSFLNGLTFFEDKLRSNVYSENRFFHGKFFHDPANSLAKKNFNKFNKINRCE